MLAEPPEGTQCTTSLPVENWAPRLRNILGRKYGTRLSIHELSRLDTKVVDIWGLV